MEGNEKMLDSVHEEIRARAKKSRKTAVMLIVIILFLGGSVAILFASLGVSNLVFIGDETILDEASISITSNDTGDLVQELTKAIIRIGSVILAVYLIQMLVSITRYHLKIADSLELRADCLLLSGGDTKKLSEYTTSLSIDHIGFEKIPELPAKELVNTLTNLAKSKKD